MEAPVIPEIEGCYDLLVTGVGGTGVITVGALITMAAHVEGKGASVLDFTGFAQKFGPVLSYIRIADDPSRINQVRIEKAQADALIGCDLVVSSSPKASGTYRRGSTRAVVNTAEMSTADFVRYRDASLRADDRVKAIEQVVGENNLSTVPANKIADALLGNTIYANVLMLGYAWQRGLVPVSLEALGRAIELNGVEVDKNKEAFDWGRLASGNPDLIRDLIAGPDAIVEKDETLDQIVQRRAEFLIDYQNHALAEKYHELVNRVRAAVEHLGAGDSLTGAVARAYFKLLAYKDEYEVARLHTQTGFLEKIEKDYGKNAKVKFHLAPPLLQSGVDARGRPRKRTFGPWMILAFNILARLRGLRGTPFDILGLSGERKMERALIVEFEDLVERILSGLQAENLSEATAIVLLTMEIRGYGPVKEEAATKVGSQIADRLGNFLQIAEKAA